MANRERRKVLFVCMGNICRSPTAEAVMRFWVERLNLAELFEIDSAGTHGYHVGKKSDSRSIKHAQKRGYELTSLSRAFKDPEDFIYFDDILVADERNLTDLLDRDLRGHYSNKVKKLTDYSSDKSVKEVPDPYYGGVEGFENVLDIIEDSVRGYIRHVELNLK